MHVPLSRLLLPSVLGVVLVGCPVDPTLPGSEVMGTFAFVASAPVADASDCALLSPEEGGSSQPLEFRAVLSREGEGLTEAWYTLREQSHPASFDGQVLSVVNRTTRRFPSCVPNGDPALAACAEVEVEEALTFALLSRSQNDAVNGVCPPGAPSAGVPVPDGTTISGPGTTPTGFDAVRACGVLVDRMLPKEGCCTPCSVSYRLEGVRR